MKIRILQARASALLVSLSFALYAAAKPFQAAPESPSTPKHAIGTKQRVAGIPNFGQVTPHLYRGGQPDFQEMKSLKEMGVDIVINMRGGRNKREKKTVESLGMRYISIPWHCPH